MTPAARNRLLLLGAVWGLALAVVPAIVMTDPYELTGFLVVALLCAAASGVVGTLVAGGRVSRRASGRKATRGAAALRGLGIGAVQGIVGGAFAALLFWTVMALTISGFTLRDPVELSVLMSPRIFLGSFFVALSAFAYTLVGGLVLGPLFGPLVERAASKEK
ncbi:MAG: hypothetical protein CYG60_18330 [Actinobacteria bacterium]|nr:hypothetical protein [Actinomycetota bacterium]PLS84369.1 MAG: hypothetical protein CYG60_18330 [Actinomycetota bacterium]